MVEGLLDDSIVVPDHSVGLPGACLAVDEQAAVVPLECVLYLLGTCEVVDIVLSGFGKEDVVEGKLGFTQANAGLVVTQEGARGIGLHPYHYLDGIRVHFNVHYYE